MNFKILFFIAISFFFVSGCANNDFSKLIEMKPNVGYVGKLGSNIEYEVASNSKWVEISFKDGGKPIFHVMVNDNATIESNTALAEKYCCTNGITLHVKNGVVTNHSLWKEIGSKRIFIIDNNGDFLPEKRIITEENIRKEESIDCSFKEIKDTSNK